jgi:predicted nucleotidyltransferase component of viral defense system
MTPSDGGPIRLHEDAALFQQAVTFTAAETGFDARLIEKDYYCTVLLQRLATACPTLVFKGGTCLAKIHNGFYRLSEDLDFSIPMPLGATRVERSRAVQEARDVLNNVETRLAGFRVATALTGSNNSTQYNAVLQYTSPADGHAESIRVEIGLREPLISAVAHGAARTLLLDPVGATPMVSPVSVPCLSLGEAMAEKVRAALSRTEAAIRDFYDVDHAARAGRLDPDDPAFLALVHRKLRVPRTGAMDVSAARLAALRGQLESDLRPVLRPADFAAFDLDRAFAAISRVAGALDALAA